MIEVLDAAYDEGIRTFMCTTHDRIGRSATTSAPTRSATASSRFYPCMPYAHKYANAVTEDGMLGAVKRFLPDEGLLNAAIRGGALAGDEGHRGHDDAAHRRRDEDVRGPRDAGRSSSRTSSSTCCSGSASRTRSAVFAEHVASRYGAEPGFITMNLPPLLTCSTRSGIENPIVCSNINKIGFRMSRRARGLRAALREREFRAVAMSVFASGAIPAAEAIEWVCAQPNIEAIVFGASSRAQHPRAPASSSTEYWASRLDHAARRLDRWPPEAAPPACTGGSPASTGPYRWATFDTPQSRSLLEGEEVEFVPFVGGRDPGNVAAQPAARAPDPARAPKSTRS